MFSLSEVSDEEEEMSSHDALMSLALQLKAALIQYNEEFDPWDGDSAEISMNELLMWISDFPMIDHEGKRIKV